MNKLTQKVAIAAGTVASVIMMPIGLGYAQYQSINHQHPKSLEEAKKAQEAAGDGILLFFGSAAVAGFSLVVLKNDPSGQSGSVEAESDPNTPQTSLDLPSQPILP